jgi:hypothetical protein
MPSFWLDPQDHRDALALVRRMELGEDGVIWAPLLDALEIDKPYDHRGWPGALASRKAPPRMLTAVRQLEDKL